MLASYFGESSITFVLSKLCPDMKVTCSKELPHAHCHEGHDGNVDGERSREG